ncbi:NS2 [Lebombo virus]|uniref:Non-structural protein NS2 n=1 Tax=Lebombo virus TaxID=40057 RepID=W5QLZ1_9REOV|nr:NS2 [Lebombo virus]AFX73383.1 NS2 [Lebombo virus]
MAQEQVQVKRKFTRTICVLDPGAKTFCGKVAKLEGKTYFVIKIGRTTQVGVSNTPVPKCYVLDVAGPGSYRVQDGQDTVSVILSESGFEATGERWEEWRFEVLSATPIVARMAVGEDEFDAEIKYSKGLGSVPPYAKNEADRRMMPTLPGVKALDMPIRDFRQHAREHRDEVRAQLDRAARRLDPSSSRLLGASVGLSEEIPIESVLPQAKREPVVFASASRELDDWGFDMQPKTSGDWGAKTPIPEVESDEGEMNDTHITTAFISKCSEAAKKHSTTFSGLSARVPAASGKFDEVILVKKSAWGDVPLFRIDEATRKFEFMAIGTSTQVLCVKDDLSYMLLPTAH